MGEAAAVDDSFDESQLVETAEDLHDLQEALERVDDAADLTFDFSESRKAASAVSFSLEEDAGGDDTCKPACASLGSTMVPGSADVSSIPDTPLDATSLTQKPLEEDARIAIPAIVAPACSAFSTRPEVSGKASRRPFDPSEAARAEDGSDDGVRVRLHFSVRLQVFGTFVNGLYHPAGTCNGRRAFRRSIGGGGCPGLFLYHLPDKDCWGVGLRRGDEKVYAVCGGLPGGVPGEQPWYVWDGSAWQPNPAEAATVLFRTDYQTSRWEEQAEAGQACSDIKKALVGVRRQAILEAKEQRMERIRNRTPMAAH